MEKVLLVGCLGYVGPAVIQDLHASVSDVDLVGLDTGFFQDQVRVDADQGGSLLSKLMRKDVRDISENDLTGVASIIYLAALSNDPMGARFPGLTEAINTDAATRLASMAKKIGVKHFVFASSASVYGVANQSPKGESDALDPLSDYAVSKVKAEMHLSRLAGPTFKVTCLRFSTACGWSPNLRLDLVLNDFVASAVTTGRIDVLSNGTPWRPLIHVRDMARAFSWSLSPSRDEAEDFVVANVGHADWNFQIRDIAHAVAASMPDTAISINTQAPPDRRSYRLDFSKWLSLAPDHQPQEDFSKTVQELVIKIQGLPDVSAEFRNSERIRLLKLQRMVDSNLLTQDLRWSSKPPSFELPPNR